MIIENCVRVACDTPTCDNDCVVEANFWMERSGRGEYIEVEHEGLPPGWAEHQGPWPSCVTTHYCPNCVRKNRL